jgi:hypothetical protein
VMANRRSDFRPDRHGFDSRTRCWVRQPIGAGPPFGYRGREGPLGRWLERLQTGLENQADGDPVEGSIPSLSALRWPNRQRHYVEDVHSLGSNPSRSTQCPSTRIGIWIRLKPGGLWVRIPPGARRARHDPKFRLGRGSRSWGTAEVPVQTLPS